MPYRNEKVPLDDGAQRVRIELSGVGSHLWDWIRKPLEDATFDCSPRWLRTSSELHCARITAILASTLSPFDQFRPSDSNWWWQAVILASCRCWLSREFSRGWNWQ